MSRTLVIILCETRAQELTYDNFKKNVIDELGADLCLCIGVKPDYDYDNPLFKLAKYKFLYNEPDDYADAFDEAYHKISKNRSKYEKMENVNTMHGQLGKPKESTENIKYCGENTNEINIDIFDDDEIIIHNENFQEDQWRNQIYSKKNTDNHFMTQDNSITYKKPLFWREFLKIQNQFLGGIKDDQHEHEGSAGILIFFRWFLLQNLINSGLIHKYDRFIVTRSDFIWQLPHPKLELLDEKYIWIPNGEKHDCDGYGAYTDRHVILSQSNVESYLNILNNFVLRSNEYYMKMKDKWDWNLEQLIKFHFIQNNVLHMVREIPYVMYCVRNINGTTRWREGTWSDKLGYYIKYQPEFDTSTYFKTEYEKSGLDIDVFYKNNIQDQYI